MDHRRFAYAVAALALCLSAGCGWPKISPESSLPSLVTVLGQAMLPDDYVIAADTQPAPRSFRAALASLGGETLAIGTITSDAGNFSVNVPAPLLSTEPSLYEVELLTPGRVPVYRSLLRLARSSKGIKVQINAATTTVALAAQEYLRSGKDPSLWNLEDLAQNATIQASALQYAYQLARWSNQTAGSIETAPPALGPSTLETVIAIASIP